MNSATVIKGHLNSLGALLMVALFSSLVMADSSRFDQFQYDGAGNMVGVSSLVVTAGPVIDSLSPSQVRQGTSVQIIASGNNLLGVDVSSASPELTATLVSAELTSAVFELTTPQDAVPNGYIVNFTTPLGSASTDITVVEGVPPRVSVVPDPLLLSEGGAPLPISVRLSAVDTFDHPLTVTIQDASIATLSGSLTIPAGATEAVGSLLITPISLGSTTLKVSAPLLPETQFPLYVAEAFSGIATPVSAPLGIALTIDESLSGGVVPVSAALGVALTIDKPLSGSVVPVSAALGVGLTIDEPLIGSLVPVTEPLGVHTGPWVDSLLPVTLTIGANDQLTLVGENLDLVTAVRFEPPDTEITFGVPAVNPEGTQLDVTISVGSSATPASQVLFLDGGFGTLPLNTVIEIIP